jgi:hydroxymethylbilane synthase
MRLTLLSRASDLATLQARQVATALTNRWPDLELKLQTITTKGDNDGRLVLADAASKGLFTADLSEAVATGVADVVVHSWKDLPVESHPGTAIAGSLERADPRDVLIVRRDVLLSKPTHLDVLTSSPRRAWQLQKGLGPLLPWGVTSLETKPVRGNIPTRLRKLIDHDGDALVVAKAALDRLLCADAPEAVSASIRAYLDRSGWMVLPIRDFPTAPAQGALAIEVSRSRQDVIDRIAAISHAPTVRAVEIERSILTVHGGGCHEAIGATVLTREYGDIHSVRGRTDDGGELSEWRLIREPPAIERADVQRIWPRPQERGAIVRRSLTVDAPAGAAGLWVARADAMPDLFTPSTEQLVWAAGPKTWLRLAARGIWVHGSSEGLGDAEPAGIDLLAGREIDWLRLTHTGSDAPKALPTYTADTTLPEDLAERTHFYWTSGSTFRRALHQYPGIRAAWHASGPGRTARALADALGPGGRVSIWLDYDEWLNNVTR